MAESSERGRAKAAESKAAPLSTPAVVNGGLEERESAVLAKGSDHRGRKLLSGLKNLVHSTSRTRSRSTQPVVPHTSRPTITHESAEVLNPTLAKTTAEGRLDPQTSFPIAELWNHAYEELRRKDSKLIEKYENQLSLSVSVMAGRTVTISDLGKVRRRDEMDELVKRKLEDDEKGKWRLPFGDDRIAIRDMTEAVVNIVAWAQEFVGDALEASPYGSLAWVGVCLLLPLALNPSKQRASNVAGLEYISDLISRCVLYENGYRQRYERDDNGRPFNSLEISPADYKSTLKELYIRILTFEARSVCQLSRSLVAGGVRAMIKVDDWDAFLEEIKLQEAKCQHFFDSLKIQEDLDARAERHNKYTSRLFEDLNQLNDGLNDIQLTLEKHHFDDEQSRCLETLRTSDYQVMKNNNPERLPGTCKWFLEHSKYQGWTAQPPISPLLWVSADPGCGKSVLAKTLVDQYDRSSVCYYFFKDDNNVSRSATHALCALLHQIYSERPALIHHILPTFRRNGSKMINLFEDLWVVFAATINDPAIGKMICILDALDECSNTERKKTLQKLAALATTSTLAKFLVTSRPYTSIESALFFKTGLDENHVHLTGDGSAEKEVIEHEIDLVITSRVQDFQELRLSEGIDDDTHEKLQSHLNSVDNRTYLWVSAIFARLDADAGAPEWELMETIKALPSDVDKAYESILNHSPKVDTLKRVLHIMLAAARPLSFTEMNVALSFKVTSSNPTYNSLYPEDSFRKWIRDLCGFFVNVVVDHLYFVHQTAREFLVGKERCDLTVGWKGSFKPVDSQTLLMQICIDYLSVIEDNLVDASFKKYATIYWVSHYQSADANQQLTDRVKNFMFQDCAVAPSFKIWISNANRLWESLEFNIPWRDTLCDACSFPPTPLFLACTAGWLWPLSELRTYHVIDWDQQNASQHTGLQIAAGKGHLEVVAQLLSAGADVNAAAGKGYYGRTALQAAAERGHLDIVNELLSAGADVNAAASDGYEGRTALQAAAEGGHLDIVNQLLSASADVNAAATKKGDRTALQAAAAGGYLDVVNQLLIADADVNANENFDQTALQAAAERGHLDIVNELLSAGADVNAAASDGYEGRTALQAAAEGGHLDIVNQLLSASADVNAAATKKGDRTALQAAAAGGYLDVVNQLLIAGADVNANENFDQTALQAAAERGHLDVVNQLLSAGADVNAAASDGYEGRTALQAAAEGGHLDIVNQLLSASADVNAAATKKGDRTALQAAAAGGYLDVVNQLLIAGADVNANENFDQTALQAAAERGHLDVVNQLLSAGADVNAAASDGYEGRTALQAAAEGGHLDIVNQLLIAGADVNAAATKRRGRTALQAAAAKGHHNIVNHLLSAGADVNAAAGKVDGRTALQAAAEGGHLDIVNQLLSAGADVNAAAGKVDGRTALQAAAEGGHLDVVNQLLITGVDVNAAASEDGGRSALQSAAEEGRLEISKMLLAAGAEINAADKKGRTTLQHAANNGNLEITQALLDAGADVNAANHRGWTALRFATKKGHFEIIEALKRAGTIDVPLSYSESEESSSDE